MGIQASVQIMNKISISPRRWLLLPIEIKVRELEAKILLSCTAAENGYGVLLGPNSFNLKGRFPKGVYLDKSISPDKEAVLKQQVDKLGNKLAVLDEEGLVYESAQKYIKTRTSAKTVSLSSLIFTWGSEQHRIINEEFDISKKLILTGAPRASLWRPAMHFLYEKECSEIKSAYGDYILISSNFSAPNNANGPEFIIKQYISCGYVHNQEEVELLRSQIAYQRKIFEKFIDLIPIIAESNPNRAVILRPHPGDNISIWKKHQTSWPPNVKVIYKGSISPWILSSAVLVHNSCTSGIEAFVMKKPAIAYTPYRNGRFDQNIPNPLSQPANTAEGVLELIKSNIENNGLGREYSKVLLCNQHIKPDDGKLASDHIIETLDKLDLPKSSYSFRTGALIAGANYLKNNIKESLKDSFEKNRINKSYKKQKNPGISLSEIKNLIDVFQRNLFRFQNVEVEQVDSHWFCFFTN